MLFWTALLLGLGGSLHCVGMCGPIVLALPLTAKERGVVIGQSLLYHFGRVTTYAIMGFFMGAMGWGIALAGWQKSLAILLGVSLIISALFSLKTTYSFLDKFQHSFFSIIQQQLRKAFTINGAFSSFKIGLLNGVLPCGLVYVALASAVVTGSGLSGAFYMAAFGLGTVPMMLAVMIFGKINRPLFGKLRSFIPYGLFIFGAFLVYRGMMLQVPEELGFWELTNFPVRCH